MNSSLFWRKIKLWVYGEGSLVGKNTHTHAKAESTSKLNTSQSQ